MAFMFDTEKYANIIKYSCMNSEIFVQKAVYVFGKIVNKWDDEMGTELLRSHLD